VKEFKKIKTFSNKIEAEIAKSFFDSHNIKAYLLADDAGSMYPSANFVSGVILLVRKKDYIKAKKLINLRDV